MKKRARYAESVVDRAREEAAAADPMAAFYTSLLPGATATSSSRYVTPVPASDARFVPATEEEDRAEFQKQWLDGEKDAAAYTELLAKVLEPGKTILGAYDLVSEPFSGKSDAVSDYLAFFEAVMFKKEKTVSLLGYFGEKIRILFYDTFRKGVEEESVFLATTDELHEYYGLLKKYETLDLDPKPIFGPPWGEGKPFPPPDDEPTMMQGITPNQERRVYWTHPWDTPFPFPGEAPMQKDFFMPGYIRTDEDFPSPAEEVPNSLLSRRSTPEGGRDVTDERHLKGAHLMRPVRTAGGFPGPAEVPNPLLSRKRTPEGVRDDSVERHLKAMHAGAPSVTAGRVAPEYAKLEEVVYNLLRILLGFDYVGREDPKPPSWLANREEMRQRMGIPRSAMPDGPEPLPMVPNVAGKLEQAARTFGARLRAADKGRVFSDKRKGWLHFVQLSSDAVFIPRDAVVEVRGAFVSAGIRPIVLDDIPLTPRAFIYYTGDDRETVVAHFLRMCASRAARRRISHQIGPYAASSQSLVAYADEAAERAYFRANARGIVANMLGNTDPRAHVRE